MAHNGRGTFREIRIIPAPPTTCPEVPSLVLLHAFKVLYKMFYMPLLIIWLLEERGPGSIVNAFRKLQRHVLDLDSRHQALSVCASISASLLYLLSSFQWYWLNGHIGSDRHLTVIAEKFGAKRTLHSRILPLVALVGVPLLLHELIVVRMCSSIRKQCFDAALFQVYALTNNYSILRRGVTEQKRLSKGSFY